jgi:hypothetical protein
MLSCIFIKKVITGERDEMRGERERERERERDSERTGRGQREDIERT